MTSAYEPWNEARGAEIIAEHDKRFDPGDAFGALKRFRTLKQGDSTLSFYKLT